VLTTYYFHVLIVLKSGSLSLLEPSRSVQVCNGIALTSFQTVRSQDNIQNAHIMRIRISVCRVKTECGGTRAETRFGLSAKQTSPFISAGVSVRSAASSRSMLISGSNAG